MVAVAAVAGAIGRAGDVAVAGADGKPVTVALFSDPTNARHPTMFFTMPVGFAYQSATLNVYREPLTIEPGKPLVLCYGVALWDGRVGAEQVDAAYKEWVAARNPVK